MGDMVHHAVLVAEPGWRNALDEIYGDPTQSREVLEASLERTTDSNTMILPGHFAYPTVGYIVSKGQSFRFQLEKAREAGQVDQVCLIPPVCSPLPGEPVFGGHQVSTTERPVAYGRGPAAVPPPRFLDPVADPLRGPSPPIAT